MIPPTTFNGYGNIQAAVLFGSCARGDSDDHSDVDIAVFLSCKGLEMLELIKRELDGRVTPPGANLSIYSCRTGEIMASEGSLFLWHLVIEGKVLYERDSWMNSLFQRLRPYRAEKALADLSTFSAVLADTEKALRYSSGGLLFDAATIYAILRNCAMIYSCSIGAPCFGRFEPITRVREAMGTEFPFDNADLRKLQVLRLAYTRNPSLPYETPDSNWCRESAAKLRTVLEFTKENVRCSSILKG